MAKLHSLLHQEWATQRSGHMQYNNNYNYKSTELIIMTMARRPYISRPRLWQVIASRRRCEQRISTDLYDRGLWYL